MDTCAVYAIGLSPQTISLVDCCIVEAGKFEKIFDRVMAFTGYKDIDFEMYPDFSNKFLIMGNKESEIRSFFTDEIIRFFEDHQIYHLESNGEALVIFDKIKFPAQHLLGCWISLQEFLYFFDLTCPFQVHPLCGQGWWVP